MQVEKKLLLEPPKPTKHEKSPPPKKLTSAKTNAGIAVIKPKKSSRTTSSTQSLIAKSKSTNDVPKKTDDELKVIASVTSKQQLPPPVNLLKTQRPPLEIHKIEGDKIIIIRRVPRAHRPAKCDLNKHKSLPSLSEATVNQVTMFVGVIITLPLPSCQQMISFTFSFIISFTNNTVAIDQRHHPSSVIE